MYVNLKVTPLLAVNYNDVNFSIATAHRTAATIKYDLKDKSFNSKYMAIIGDKTQTVLTNSTPASFDIETTNVADYDKKGKCTKAEAYMYKWQFGIGDTIIHGRKWGEFLILLNAIYTSRPVNGAYFFRCFIANLGFEFQFMRKHLYKDGWDINIFARENRQPMTVMIRRGDFFIVFQDALLISNSSLEKLCDLYTLPSKKKAGDLDYSKLRNSMTPLTAKEMDYCSFDCRTLNEFFTWIVTNYVNQGHAFPLTSTGLVRNDCKELFERFETKTYKTKSGRIKKTPSTFRKTTLPALWPETYEEYAELIDYGFSGGFTHANALHVDLILNDVNGGDFTSSYPYTIMFQKFPMSKFEYADVHKIEDIVNANRKDRASIFKIKFYNLTTTTTHSTLSISKMYEYGENNKSLVETQKACNVIGDNGRIVYADYATFMLTDIDLIENVLQFYTCDSYEILWCKQAHYDYLPDYVRYNVASSYMKKNMLKQYYKSLGLEPGDFADYGIAKAMVNSNYGMMCQHLETSEILYDEESGEWARGIDIPEEKDVSPEIAAECAYQKALYNNKGLFKQFLSPFWGVWVTSHARGNLFKILRQINEDAVYCDTDSIYYLNPDKHQPICDTYNDAIHTNNAALVDKWNAEHNFDRSYYDTLSDDEKEKYLWQTCGIIKEHFITLGEFEKLNTFGNYTRFKTLGAKRYLKEGPEFNKKTGKVESTIIATVAGLPKKALPKYCKDNGIDPFDFFNNNMTVPKCKRAHKYNDETTTAIITDEYGNTEEMTELSSLGIFDIDFSMKLTSEFTQLILEYKKAKERVNTLDLVKEAMKNEKKTD